jgi:hypothetical protein
MNTVYSVWIGQTYLEYEIWPILINLDGFSTLRNISYSEYRLGVL